MTGGRERSEDKDVDGARAGGERYTSGGSRE